MGTAQGQGAAVGLTAASAMAQASSTTASGKAQLAAGIAQQKAFESQAAQARQIAGQTRASAQRSAFDQRRAARLAESRALAVGAASGAGTGDPTFVNLVGNIGAEGEYRALTALYEGEDRARQQEFQAALQQYQGDQARLAGELAYKQSKRQAFSQILGGLASATSMATKYGWFDPKPGNAAIPTTTTSQSATPLLVGSGYASGINYYGNNTFGPYY